jgi:hypothetical protein
MTPTFATVNTVKTQVKAFQFTSFDTYNMSCVEILTGGHTKWFGVNFGMIVSFGKETRTIFPTEWVVRHDNGLIMIYKQHEFDNLFEAVD